MSKRGRARWNLTIAVVLTALVPLAPLAPTTAQNPDDIDETGEIIEPLDLGLTERTGRRLMFIDVEAVDKEGRPLPGLTKKDFRIKLDYAWRDLYSVDNLCPCSRDGEAVQAGAAAAQNVPVFVLYLDFSALQLDGRAAALDHARRWVQEIKQPGDRAMVVAYSSIAGLQTRCRLTRDKEELLRVLDEVDADPDMLDPFPSGLSDRIETCRTGTVSCYATGRRDYFQTRRSFRTLMYFLTLLDDIPERKVMLFFHQNNAISPGKLYSFSRAGRTMVDGSSSGLVPDNLKLLGRLAGTATTSRTAVYPIVSGEALPWAVNAGANLADFTGGAFNRGPGDAEGVIGAAGRGCPCIYRLGLEAPERSRSKVYRAKIRAGGEVLPSRYRLQFLTEYDRWERRAMAVLNSPQDATDLRIHAGLVPVEALEGKWRLSVQVGFDVEALELTPEGGQWAGEWEVGALLSDERGRQTWEMLAVSRILRKKDAPSETTVLHERIFDALKPGVYELRAFVRDRTANTFGGARTDIDLPRPGGSALAGPLLMRPRQPYLLTELPFLKGKDLDGTWQGLERRVGSIPLADHPLSPGAPLQMVTWACPADPGVGFVRGVTGAVLRTDLEGAGVVSAGQCVAIHDEIATSNAAPGNYVYHVGLVNAPDPPAEIRFTITPEPEPR